MRITRISNISFCSAQFKKKQAKPSANPVPEEVCHKDEHPKRCEERLENEKKFQERIKQPGKYSKEGEKKNA